MSNTEENDEFQLGVDTIADIDIIMMPDKFHFNKVSGQFYELTPFGTTLVNHESITVFFNKLKEKFGSHANFLDMITDLTEFRIIEPLFYVEMYNKVTDEITKNGGSEPTTVFARNLVEIQTKYSGTNVAIVDEIYAIASKVISNTAEKETNILELLKKDRKFNMMSKVKMTRNIPVTAS